MNDCPICTGHAGDSKLTSKTHDGSDYDCPNCGIYFITRTALNMLREMDSASARTALSHAVWKNQGRSPVFEVTSEHIRNARAASLPNPAEMLDLYILFLGDQMGSSPGNRCKVKNEFLRAKMSAISENDVTYINKMASAEGLLESTSTTGFSGGTLTLAGWKFYETLKRGKAAGQTAFMAMPFGNRAVTEIVDETFRAAVAETGFKLKRVDEAPRAGSIDDRMRVEIRMCRFLIADLTCENRGAYWEAGFAEGLGKPVIYTCNKFYFESQGTHFDTNHHHTVLWDPNDPTKAAEDLKNTIRATLPDEAIMPSE